MDGLRYLVGLGVGPFAAEFISSATLLASGCGVTMLCRSKKH
jgi:hypothetical protein